MNRFVPSWSSRRTPIPSLHLTKGGVGWLVAALPEPPLSEYDGLISTLPMKRNIAKLKLILTLEELENQGLLNIDPGLLN